MIIFVDTVRSDEVVQFMPKWIYSPESVFQADTLRELLRREGVESTLENEHRPQWQETSITPPMAISVADIDAERATKIIQEYCDRRKDVPIGRYEKAVISRGRRRERLFYLGWAAFVCLILVIVGITDHQILMVYSAGIVSVLLIGLLAYSFTKRN